MLIFESQVKVLYESLNLFTNEDKKYIEKSFSRKCYFKVYLKQRKFLAYESSPEVFDV